MGSEAMEPSPIITIRNLKSHYQGKQVLHDISFEVPSHQITVIMGMSGCGKTTLLRHLVALKGTDLDQIEIDGRDMGRFEEKELSAYRRRIGVLFQSGALFNSLTVAENIAVPLKVHTALPDEIIRIMALIKLNMVGLVNVADQLPSQLSGGMRKRAGLARALAMDPEILFVDEPSAGLDPITAAALDQLILDLKETLGMTIIVVTHELRSAFDIADQMVVMDAGRILQAGRPEEIRNSGSERVQQFLRREADQGSLKTEEYITQLMA